MRRGIWLVWLGVGCSTWEPDPDRDSGEPVGFGGPFQDGLDLGDDGGDQGGDDRPGLPGSAAAVCERWRGDRFDRGEGTWNGSAGVCEPGTLSADGHANTLKMVNLYRWMSGLPEVDASDAKDLDAQACALIMHANSQISHHPDDSWECHTPEGDDAASSSNLATAPGVYAVDMYMIDTGNLTTLGHRRWILANSLGPIGIGSTDRYSCLHVIGGQGNAGEPWTAWPPPGYFPVDAGGDQFGTIDQTGWHVQSDTINLADAEVRVKVNGQNKLIEVAPLLPGYGSSTAVAIRPQGWVLTAGTRYTVEVYAEQDFSYDFEAVNCADH